MLIKIWREFLLVLKPFYEDWCFVSDVLYAPIKSASVLRRDLLNLTMESLWISYTVYIHIYILAYQKRMAKLLLFTAVHKRFSILLHRLHFRECIFAMSASHPSHLLTLKPSASKITNKVFLQVIATDRYRRKSKISIQQIVPFYLCLFSTFGARSFFSLGSKIQYPQRRDSRPRRLAYSWHTERLKIGFLADVAASVSSPSIRFIDNSDSVRGGGP